MAQMFFLVVIALNLQAVASAQIFNSVIILGGSVAETQLFSPFAILTVDECTKSRREVYYYLL